MDMKFLQIDDGDQKDEDEDGFIDYHLKLNK